MFHVRSTQISAFELAARADFEDEMAGHCRESAPGRCRALGAARLRRAIHHSVDAAAAHGLTERGPVRLHVELALHFGSGFATDPQYPWAREQLAREELLDQLLRADALHERATAYLKHVGEPDSHAARTALLRLATIGAGASMLPDEARYSASPDADPALRSALVAEAHRAMEQAYPEKCAHVGSASLDLFATDAVSRAWSHHGFRSPRLLVLMASVAFAFGHRCDEDPFHPWIGEALTKSHGEASLEREVTRWLEAAATGYLGRGEAWLS